MHTAGCQGIGQGGIKSSATTLRLFHIFDVGIDTHILYIRLLRAGEEIRSKQLVSIQP